MKSTVQISADIYSRKFIVVRGESTLLFNLLAPIAAKQQGDWVTITNQLTLPPSFTRVIMPNQAKGLLGQEFTHAIFDATQGFHLDAFAALTGTLVKGSLLILLLPSDLCHFFDRDSLRWNEKSTPIATPNFTSHLQGLIAQKKIPTYAISKSRLLTKIVYQHLAQLNAATKASDNANYQQQQTVLNQLRNSDKPILAVTAKRGRGKSALAGLFTHYHSCIVTAPNKSSLTSFYRFAKQPVAFYPPDELCAISLPKGANYLIIDEAAMIPLPLLTKLLTLPYNILLMTTIEGYEGTGQGFLLKLLDNKSVDYFQLTEPIRWQEGDIIEQFSEELLLSGFSAKPCGEGGADLAISYQHLVRQDIDSLKCIYQLLKSAHYRTTPTDLRRLFDADNLSVWHAKRGADTIGALLAIEEGGLDKQLIEAVWQGTRRPKGNLVAQSLVAHAGAKLAAKLRSLRINRIAVTAKCRRQKVASKLIEQQLQSAVNQKRDFLSVSFACSDENLRFWHACGFTLVHVATHKEASSGTYSVMAIRAISQQGQLLKTQLHSQLQRNWIWLRDIIDLQLDIKSEHLQHLTAQDWDDLHGFARYHRPFEASYPALCRLHLMLKKSDHSRLALPLFTDLIGQKRTMQQVINANKLTGRQQLIQHLKTEVAQLLIKIAP